MRDTKRDDRESAARGPRAFAVLGIVLVLALCGAGLALARSGEQLRDVTPLVDESGAPRSAASGFVMPMDWTEDDVPAPTPGAARRVAPLAALLAMRDEVAALESRVVALEALAARR